MRLGGSCHCGRVRFSVHSSHPYPFNRCYCSICRKTAGGGGYAINLGADFSTLKVEGEEHISVYQALIRDPGTGESRQSRRAGISAATAAVPCGCGIRAGRSWCIRMRPRLIANCRCRRSIPI